MELLEYNDKNTTLNILKKVINTGNIEKAAFCGIGLLTCITNSTVGKVCMSIVFIRKLISIYKNNRHEMNALFDKII